MGYIIIELIGRGLSFIVAVGEVFSGADLRNLLSVSFGGKDLRARELIYDVTSIGRK